jgi:XrtJ-associated TM-motif-TM protein
LHFPAVAFVLLLVAALLLRAQGGCVDSPEDPIFMPALVAVAGALIASVHNSCNPERSGED